MKLTTWSLILLFLFVSHGISLAQTDPQNAPARISKDNVVEVTYYKGRTLAYQRVGEWSWYELFPRVADWKPKPGEQPVAAVRVMPREENGVVTVKISVYRGRNHEVEDPVTEVTLGTSSVAVKELLNFGVAPFELRLVRAPSTVAELPAINNGTKSLVVSVEPALSTLPSFKVKVLNSSQKPVIGFSYRTSIKDQTKLIGMPQDRKGGVLIEPGATYELTLRYALTLMTESTGEVPPAMTGLQLNILSVMFLDGTYEGNRIDAARFRGYKEGEKIQLARIVDLLKSSAASTPESLAIKTNELNYHITTSDLGSLLTEFPGLPEAEIENLRSAAEVSALDIQKDFRKTFGGQQPIDRAVFPDAVKAATVKCEKWIDFLP